MNAHSKTGAALPPEAHQRGGQPPKWSPQTRIFNNDFGTFYMVASEPYWSARAGVIRKLVTR